MKVALLFVVVCTVTVVSLVPSTAAAHERKEVAGLMVLLWAEPEPALTEEVESLRWRFTSPESMSHSTSSRRLVRSSHGTAASSVHSRHGVPGETQASGKLGTSFLNRASTKLS